MMLKYCLSEQQKQNTCITHQFILHYNPKPLHKPYQNPNKVCVNSRLSSIKNSIKQLQGFWGFESFEFKLPPDHHLVANSQDDPYLFNSQSSSVMQMTNSFLKAPIPNNEIHETPRNIKMNNQDYFKILEQDQGQVQNQYAILYGSQNDGKIQKQFGVYQFDEQPIFDKKPQRLIQRLAIKQEIEGTSFKKRSIPGGAGMQIVFQNNNSSKPTLIDAQSNQKVEEQTLPKKLPKFEAIQKQKNEVFSRTNQQQKSPFSIDDFKQILWGYLSCADKIEMQKLFKLSEETKIIRDFKDLQYNKPFPFTQTKEQRFVSPLYIAVATGSLETLKILFEELININIEQGLEIRKRQKDDNEFMVSKMENIIKKRSPLQLACALGLYKIVEYLLEKGANPNGNQEESIQAIIDNFCPPIVLCLNRKHRHKITHEEMIGIDIWKIYEQTQEIDHVICLDLLLKYKGDSNLYIQSFSPSRPYPIFHALKEKILVEKLIENGCNVNLQNQDNLTPLCKLCTKMPKNLNDFTDQYEEQQLQIIQVLHVIGNSKIVYCCKANPIIECIKRMKFQIAKYLALKGGDVNWRQPNTPSIVQIAVDQNNAFILKEILSWPKLDPIDFHYVDEEGKNIFHKIAERKNPELFIRIAESKKFNPAMIYKYINEPISNMDFDTLPIIMCCPMQDLADLYIKFGASVETLSFSQCFDLLSSNHIKFLEFLVKKGGLNIDEIDASNKTSLQRASDENDVKKMQFLLRLGADPDVFYQYDDPQYEQHKGMTMIQEACLLGKVDKVRVLLQFGANINIKDSRGRSTLDFLKINHEQKSNRRRDEIKALLYKQTVKNQIFSKNYQ